MDKELKPIVKLYVDYQNKVKYRNKQTWKRIFFKSFKKKVIINESRLNILKRNLFKLKIIFGISILFLKKGDSFFYTLDVYIKE